jgi:hypothetical protein
MLTIQHNDNKVVITGFKSKTEPAILANDLAEEIPASVETLTEREQTIYLVLVNNGDTEPEVYAFEEEADADAYGEARAGAGDWHTQSMTPIDHATSLDMIASEKEGF